MEVLSNPKSCEETSGMYLLQLHKVPTDIDLILQDRLQAFHEVPTIHWRASFFPQKYTKTYFLSGVFSRPSGVFSRLSGGNSRPSKFHVKNAYVSLQTCLLRSSASWMVNLCLAFGYWWSKLSWTEQTVTSLNPANFDNCEGGQISRWISFEDSVKDSCSHTII